jgi:hypothetical protein
MFGGKSLIATVFCGVVFASASASAAFAGEVTGNGKDTAGPQHANSICVFSGKNDDPQGLNPEENGPGGVSQSYGQEVKLGIQNPHEVNPGDACRGGSNFARQ